MKRLILVSMVAMAACAMAKSDYVVAVEKATNADGAWKQVVEALRTRHGAEVLVYDGNANLGQMLAALRKTAPKYVCFVSKPETAGRDLVVNAAQLLRKLDDDPWGDALWGIVTGFDAADALRMAKAPAVREIRTMSTSMGSPDTLKDWPSGFASDEGNRNRIWRKTSGGAIQQVDTAGNPAKALAAAFNEIDTDYWFTSGHATQHDWQIIYNQNAGQLRHDDQGNLIFRDPQGGAYPLTNKCSRTYVAAGNCLIGNIDQRACMATAWMHSGVDQMVGYTVVTFYGFMGWGAKTMFEEARCSLAEAYYLQNQVLLWWLGRRDGKLRTCAVDAQEFGPKGRTMKGFAEAHKRQVANRDEFGLLWDRDTVAFYGDPAQRVMFPRRNQAMEVATTREGMAIKFLKSVNFGALQDYKSSRPVAAFLGEKPCGRKLVDATGKAVEQALVADNFVIVPLTGSHAAGEKLNFKFAKGE